MVLDNDVRGWIMTALSGIACMFGSLLICIDLIIRRLPSDRFKDFQIQDSNAFLSSSLSLSFGVMLFSSLYNMLPSSKSSLIKGGFSPKAAAWTLIACFLAGAAGIQLISRVLHRFIPSQVVDCDHTHDDLEDTKTADHDHQSNGPPRHVVDGHRQTSHRSANGHLPAQRPRPASSDSMRQRTGRYGRIQRPPLQSRFSSRMSQLVSSQKPYCDINGQCYGYTDPCGMDCFRNLQQRGGAKLHLTPRPLSLQRSTTLPGQRTMQQTEYTPLLAQVDEEDDATLAPQPTAPAELSHTSSSTLSNGSPPSPHSTHASDTDAISPSSEEEADQQHHHHVPTNAFLSIGLQTCLAIALHKLPEGFITYATNHANPKLGTSVFLALFIHNITEGFAMALPLFLALQSRMKAIIWSSILGGVSQPLGAGVAALWFHFASGRPNPSGDGGGGEGGGWMVEPGEGVYGCLFACTAGILASVALQLFSESMDLTHNRNLCMAFAFVGMGILGVSGALTA